MPDIHAMPTDKTIDRLFNPGLRDSIAHISPSRFSITNRLLSAIEGDPSCDDLCVRKLLAVVSCHVKSRGLNQLQAAAGLVRALAEVYDAFLISKHELVHYLDTTGLGKVSAGEMSRRSKLQTHAAYSLSSRKGILWFLKSDADELKAAETSFRSKTNIRSGSYATDWYLDSS